MCTAQEAGIYLRHELEAHALAYKAIKALPGKADAIILPSCMAYAFDNRPARSVYKPSSDPQPKMICMHGRHATGSLYTIHEALSCILLHSGGDKAQVGICHNVFWTEPMRGGPFYAHVR